jgi:signal transduction histidine kinase
MEAMQSTGRHEKSLELATRRLDGSVEVSVRAHGCGMSPEQVEKLFQPYFTTKSSGMDLGLSTCRTTSFRTTVEQHEGRLAAEPLTDGRRFKFTLPIGAGQSYALSSAGPPAR